MAINNSWVRNRLSINLNVVLIELSSPKSPVRNAAILTIKCGVPGILFFFDLSDEEEDHPLHPLPITNVRVQLIGEDGNAFAILGKVQKVLQNAGYDDTFIKEFMQEATSGSYDDLLQVVQNYVYVD